MIARDLFVPLKVNGEGSFQNTISILFQTGKFEFFGILSPPLMAIILNILIALAVNCFCSEMEHKLMILTILAVEHIDCHKKWHIKAFRQK